MAFTDLTRTSTYNQKKTECFVVAKLTVDTRNIGVASGNFTVANLPPDSVITDCYLMTEVVSDAGTSAAMTVGTSEGGSEVMSAGDMTTLNETGTFTGKTFTVTGKTLYVGVTIVGTVPTTGIFYVVVQYTELLKNNGQYTII